MSEVTSQLVRWGPADGAPAGLQIVGGEFIPWKALQEEIKKKLLPQVEALNKYQCYSLVLLAHHGKKDWLLRIIAKDKSELVGIWFGPNPQGAGAPYDGRIRVGKSFRPAIIWNTFERYSDGTYRRIS